MGMGKPSGGIISISARRLDDHGDPNSRVDRYNENGELVQQRWYGPDGRAILNRDWKHGGSGHTFPHDHPWDWTKNPPRQKAEPVNNNFT